MPLDAAVRRRLQKLLSEPADSATLARFDDDARRLWNRTLKLLGLGLINTDPDLDALEIACIALQLPLAMRTETGTKLGSIRLLDRAEQAAELLVGYAGSQVDPGLLDRGIRLLHEAAQRNPMTDDARILADAVNLDDFGLSGLLTSALRMGLSGGLATIIQAFEKREAYGYWNARLKDGFHFDATRTMALRRLEAARNFVRSLREELDEDRPT